ncbi:hypothetical protein [Amycolatopsis lexingtonensis]
MNSSSARRAMPSGTPAIIVPTSVKNGNRHCGPSWRAGFVKGEAV